MDAQELRNLQEAYSQVYELDEAFKPMNEPKMQNQIKKHLERNNAKRESGEKVGSDRRVGNMRNAISVIGKQQKSKSFADKKTEKGRRTAAKSGADNFLLRDKWNASQQVRGRKPTVPNRHIARDEEGHKKHLDRLKKSGVNENYDLYDIILSHLLDEGYADTQESAHKIMVNMSEDWRQSIVEAAKSEEPDPFGRPGGKHGGVRKGGGYEKGYEAMKKKIKELEDKK